MGSTGTYSIHTISDLKSVSKPQGSADLFACHSRPVHVNYLAGAPFFYSELIWAHAPKLEMRGGWSWNAISCSIRLHWNTWECNHGQHGQAALGAAGLRLYINLPSHFDSPILLPESSTFGRGSLPLRVHTKFVQSWASLPTTLQDKRPRPENPSCGPWLRRSGEQTLHRQRCHPCQASLNIASHDVLCDCCNSKSCPWTWWQHIAMRCN